MKRNKAQQGLESLPVGRKISPHVNIPLVYSPEAHRISSICLASIYDTFPRWVGGRMGGLTVI